MFAVRAWWILMCYCCFESLLSLLFLVCLFLNSFVFITFECVTSGATEWDSKAAIQPPVTWQWAPLTKGFAYIILISQQMVSDVALITIIIIRPRLRWAPTVRPLECIIFICNLAWGLRALVPTALCSPSLPLSKVSRGATSNNSPGKARQGGTAPRGLPERRRARRSFACQRVPGKQAGAPPGFQGALRTYSAAPLPPPG